MYVEELSDELGVKPRTLAQRTRVLGLGELSPDTELSPQQEAALRASFPPSDNRKKIAAVVGGALALIAAVAFFMMQSSEAEQRQQDISEDLESWEEAPPATVAPEAQAAATFPPNVPRDQAKFCAAWETINEQEASGPEIDGLQRDFTAYRSWAADRGVWWAAIDEAVKTGPPDGAPAHTNYRDMQQRYYAAITNASDSDLRGLADGIALNDFENWERDTINAVRDLKPYVIPHCGNIIG